MIRIRPDKKFESLQKFKDKNKMHFKIYSQNLQNFLPLFHSSHRIFQWNDSFGLLRKTLTYHSYDVIKMCQKRTPF